jgi:hypothetical protein
MNLTKTVFILFALVMIGHIECCKVITVRHPKFPLKGDCKKAAFDAISKDRSTSISANFGCIGYISRLFINYELSMKWAEVCSVPLHEIYSLSHNYLQNAVAHESCEYNGD